MDPNDKKSSVLAMEVNPVTAIDPFFCKWEDQRLGRPTIGCYIGNKASNIPSHQQGRHITD